MRLNSYLKGVGVGVLVTTLVLTATNMLKPDMTDDEIKARAKELGMVEAYESGVLSDDSVSSDALSKDDTQQVKVELPALLQDEALKDEAEKAGLTESPAPSADAGERTADGEDAKPSVKPSEEPGADKLAEPSAKPTTEPSKEPSKEPTVTPSKEPTVTPSKEPSKEPTVTPSKVPSKEPSAKPTAEPSKAPAKAADDKPAGANVTITVNSGEGSETVARKLADAGIVESAAAFDRYLCQNGYDSRIAVGTYEFTKGMSNIDIAERLMRR